MGIEHMTFMNVVLYRFMLKFALKQAIPSNLTQAPVRELRFAYIICRRVAEYPRVITILVKRLL